MTDIITIIYILLVNEGQGDYDAWGIPRGRRLTPLCDFVTTECLRVEPNSNTIMPRSGTLGGRVCIENYGNKLEWATLKWVSRNQVEVTLGPNLKPCSEVG